MNNELTSKIFSDMVTLEQKYIKLQDQMDDARQMGDPDTWTELNGQCIEIREEITALSKKLGIQ